MKPAARASDLHVCPMVTGIVPHVGGPIMPPGHPMTLIGGLPAARVGDMAICVGPPDFIVMGSTGVMIAGKPAARMGDQTAHGGIIVLGFPTVLIGDSGKGSGGSGGPAGSAVATLQAIAMRTAKASKKPFCEECAKLARQNAARQSTAGSEHGEAVRAAKAERLPFCAVCAKH